MANSRSKFITQGRQVLPGSNESGVLCASKFRVPPLWSEGLTTVDKPPLNAATVLGGAVLVLVLVLVPVLVPPASGPPLAGCPDTSRPTVVPTAATSTARARAA